MTSAPDPGPRPRLTLLGLSPAFAERIERDLNAAQVPAEVRAIAHPSGDFAVLADADLVLVDPKSGSLPTADLLARIRGSAPGAALAVLTRHADGDDLYQVVRVGGIERYWLEPWSPVHAVELAGLLSEIDDRRQRGRREREIEETCARLAEANQALRAARDSRLDWSWFPQSSTAMATCVAGARRLAASGADLCLVGEPGSGRTTLASAIHANGPCAAEPLVRLPASLLPRRPSGAADMRGFELESALRIAAKWEAAGNGTLFVGDIEDLDEAAQAVLAGLVAGNLTPSRARPRLIASASAEPAVLEAEGSLHPKLAERLSSSVLRVPSLCLRRDDLAALAAQLLGDWAERLGRPAPALAAAALDQLGALSLDGNIPELREVLEEAAALATTPRIERIPRASIGNSR